MVVILELKCRWTVDDLFWLTKMISHLCCKYISIVESLPYLQSDAIRYTNANGCSYLIAKTHLASGLRNKSVGIILVYLQFVNFI